jgi:hypothetical protein
MSNIAIENFLKMSPEIPQYTDKNQHYLISGANPTYYLDVGGQEEQVAPLIASLEWVQFGVQDGQFIPIEGKIVDMIPSSNSTFSIYFITDTLRVYGVTPAFGVVNLGYANGTGSSGKSGVTMCIGSGTILGSIVDILFVTWTNAKDIWYTALPGTIFSTWTNIGTSNIRSTQGINFMVSFNGYIALVDSFSGGFPNNWIDRFDPTNFIVTNPKTANTLDIGIGMNILGIKNYNDKYLAIACAKTLGGSGIIGYTENYLYMWDGISLLTNFRVSIPGKYVDMKVIDGVLYVTVKVSSTKTILYMLYNNTLRQVITPQYSTISELIPGSTSVVPNSIFNYNNNVGIRLDSVSEDSLTNPLMIYGKQDIGTSEFILSAGINPSKFCIGYDGVLYASLNPLSGNNNLAYYPKTSTSPYFYSKILYKSQWIPVKNLQAIDIYHDSPPTNGSYIDVTIEGQGEDYQNSVSQPVSTHLLPKGAPSEIYSISSTTYLTNKRTRLDIQGFTGDQIRITLKTINSGTWRPKINAIVPIVK